MVGPSPCREPSKSSSSRPVSGRSNRLVASGDLARRPVFGSAGEMPAGRHYDRQVGFSQTIEQSAHGQRDVRLEPGSDASGLAASLRLFALRVLNYATNYLVNHVPSF